MVLNFDGRRYYPATATADGLMSAGDYVRLHTTLGSADANVPGANVAVAATTVTQIAGPITLAAGIWEIEGEANILMGAGAGTADIYLRQGVTKLDAVATFVLAAGAQAGGPTGRLRVTPTVSTAYNLACFSTAACTARALAGGAGGFNNMLWIRATRLA
jgi:hypothetical protein